MTNAPAIHAFEKAGLGFAPFHCVGVASIPSPSLAAANPTAYNNALAMLPRDIGCGSCQFCGTGIMHNYIIRDRDGRRFVVGSECVNRTGDAGLISTVKGERKRMAAEKRAERGAVTRAAREASYKAIREARAADFVVTHAALIERAQPFMKEGGFIHDVLTGGTAGRYVSEKAIDTVTRLVGELIQRAIWKAASRPVGVAGKRMSFNVVVDRVASYSRPSFSGWYGQETVWIITMRDEAGNAIVSKSTSFFAERGERFTMKATVKEHSNYDGEVQTIVQRIKREG